MNTKLTLSVDNTVIKKAKMFAKNNHTSLSQLIESYLLNITREEHKIEEEEISPLVKSLSGILKLPSQYDYKKDISHHLEDKYQ